MYDHNNLQGRFSVWSCVFQSVRDKSGHKLILLLRSPNKLPQKSITLLKKRRDVLKLTNPGNWPVVRGDFITLIKDWDDEVSRGLIKPDQKWSVDDVKELLHVQRI